MPIFNIVTQGKVGTIMGFGGGSALLVVLFILLIIVGAACFC
ncbi:YjcZ family sporulation protein [Bacillus sp. R86525]